MSVLKQRKQSMEARFARDGELAFQARIQAFRFLATWATTLKGDPPGGEKELVQALIRADMRAPGDDRAIAALRDHLGDLADEALLRQKLDEFLRDARAAILFAEAS